MQKIQITSPGIQKALKRYKSYQAIAEYIWNGFDAKATHVKLELNCNDIGNLQSISILDDGYGINHSHLTQKFTPFFESEKEFDPITRKKTSAVHGKNGVGRLTFFTFALQAIWQTVYQENGQNYKFSITVKTDSLNSYLDTSPEITDGLTGTKVTFLGIHAFTAFNFETDIKEYLIKEFGWFLELNKAKGYKITIDNEILDYSQIIPYFCATAAQFYSITQGQAVSTRN